MTDIQAALGMSQLIRIDTFVARRHELADRYNEAFQGQPLTLPWQHVDTFSSYHLYVVRLMLDRLTKTHRQVFDELRAEGILVNLHYIPVHLQPYYQNRGFSIGNFPQAEKYYDEAITLPMYAGLTDDNQKIVIDSVKKVLQ
jgi:dTDP-4-amino-4,6-dideoxygalactose transaminase